MGVDHRQGQSIRFRVVHGNEHLPLSHCGGYEGPNLDFRSPETDPHPLSGRNSPGVRIHRVQFHINPSRIETLQHSRSLRPGLGVPLCGTSPSRQQHQGKPLIGKFRIRLDGIENELGPLVLREKPPVSEESPLGFDLTAVTFRDRPS